MALRTANFISDTDTDGVVLYDSVTMYVYPVLFKSENEVDKFLLWFEHTYHGPFNGYSGNHYYTYELWISNGSVKDPFIHLYPPCRHRMTIELITSPYLPEPCKECNVS